MKKFLLTACALLCVTGTSMASVFTLPTDSPLYFQFNNMEQVSTTGNDIVIPGGYYGTNTQGNWGVFNVSSLQQGAVATQNVDISGGQSILPTLNSLGGPQITGIFYGINLLTGTTATGGFLDLYWHDVGNVTAADLNGGAGPTASTVTQFTTGNGGTFLARLTFASGIDPLASTTFIKSTTDPTTLGGSGQADSFANVDTTVAGAWTDALNGDWFITAFGTRDLRFSNFFNNTLQSTWGTTDNSILGLRSNDPGRVFTATQVPEPSTVVMLGLGLLGLGFSLRRKS